MRIQHKFMSNTLCSGQCERYSNWPMGSATSSSKG